MVFVDTDLLISALRKNDTEVNRKARKILKRLFQTGQVKITIFNYAELYEGTFWSPNVAKSQRILNEFLKKFEVVPFSLTNSMEFAQISAELEMKGEKIGDMDELIASIVIGQDETFLTRNIQHFERIKHLKLINWEYMEIPDK